MECIIILCLEDKITEVKIKLFYTILNIIRYCKVGNIRGGFIFAIFGFADGTRIQHPRELLINDITHTVNVTSRYI